MKVGDCDTSSKDGIIGMCDSHICRSLGGLYRRGRSATVATCWLHTCAALKRLADRTYKIIQLNGCDALIDPRDDLLSYGSSIDVICVEAITQSRNTSSDLVELDSLLTPICENEWRVSHQFFLYSMTGHAQTRYAVGKAVTDTQLGWRMTRSSDRGEDQ